MLTSIRRRGAAKLLSASFFAGSLLLGSAAQAQSGDQTPLTDPVDTEITGPIAVSGNVALASEYRFRGVDLSGGEFAIQGGIDVVHQSGFYVGAWASSLDEDTVGFGSTELDIYGGWSGQLTEAFSAEIGVLRYIYPDAGPGDFDYTEFYASTGFTFGPAQATLGVAYAPKQDSLGNGDNFYIYTDVSAGIPNTPVTLTGHLGYTDGFLTFTDDGKAFDFSVGGEIAIPDTPLSLGIAYAGAQGDIPVGEYDFVDDAVVFMLSASF